ncbi:tricorn protease [Natronospira proteinivora]|uniref:Tricorn protease n=1 Tax=Natronospira proteinivora TaxID=1807133 RepID=A0ABT1G6M0_9GAMM|nr:S41 family peptidase [Natronospira proteinivora]MCP1726901.1 tricorn protease [Natronospira proteinivora]
MEARFFRGQWDESGDRLAYIDFGPAYNGLYGGSAGWRGYRGGTTPSIRILNSASDSVTNIEGERVNDIEPFWLDGDVYFVSDRADKRFNLFRFDSDSETIEQLTEQDDWDIRWASGHGSHIVYEAGGRLHELDLENGEVSMLSVHIKPDLPQRRVEWKDASNNIQHARISPQAKRLIVTARGEVFTVPVDEGSTRNLSNTGGIREYTATWSPDGAQVAWLEESLEGQTLVISDQTGRGEQERFELGPEFYTLRAWDAENSRIIYTDNRQGLHYIDLDRGQTTQVDTGTREGGIDLALSPDGTWLAYTKRQANYYRDLKVYSFERNEAYPLSDGMADVASPVFSRDGKHLYFAASTNSGPLQFGLDMSSQERPYRAGLYAIVLQDDHASPLLPGTGDETVNKGEEEEEEVETRIDFQGLLERTVALGVAEGNYGDLQVAKDGSLFYMHRIQPGVTREPPGATALTENRLKRFDFEERQETSMISGLTGFDISAAGSHLLLQMVNGSLAVAEINREIEPETVNLSDLRLEVDPMKEWTQIFDEAWRMQRDFFYAENLHGVDWDAVYEQYRPLLEHVGRREDLNDLMIEMIAELHAGHNRLGGGDIHRVSSPETGLLGANLSVSNGRYRIDRIYTGENWNPFLRGPLAVPGHKAEEGEYIIAINGRELNADENIFQRLKNTVDEQVTLRVGPNANGRNAREITVEPVSSENRLRLWAWVESNRKAVEEATDGRVGYIYLPNTADDGYAFFNRMFYAQLDKEALIIDERANGGGQAANYITEVLSRRHLANWAYREGKMSSTPFGALHGPKLMMIDQDAGSGGDFMPYAFRELDIGKLLGTRTWGGLIGISRNPSLMDGGFMTVPHFRFIDTDNNWSIENEGVAPDIHVELDPIATNQGRDSQLEEAIDTILEQLETYEDDIPREQPPLPTQPGR